MLAKPILRCWLLVCSLINCAFGKIKQETNPLKSPIESNNFSHSSWQVILQNPHNANSTPSLATVIVVVFATSEKVKSIRQANKYMFSRKPIKTNPENQYRLTRHESTARNSVSLLHQLRSDRTEPVGEPFWRIKEKTKLEIPPFGVKFENFA